MAWDIRTMSMIHTLYGHKDTTCQYQTQLASHGKDKHLANV